MDATELFRRHAIGMVMFEFGGCNIDTRTFFRDFWHFFTDARMQLYRITPGGYLDLLSHYSESLEQFRTTNFLAVAPAGRHDGAAGDGVPRNS